MKFIKFIKEHKGISIIIIMIIFILPVVIINTLFKIAAPYEWLIAEWTAGELLNYWGAILGAAATIIAIVLTIRFTIENQKDERKLSIKPCLNTTYKPMFIRTESIVSGGEIVYIMYPLNEKDENENIGASYEPTYSLKKAEEDKVKGTLDSLSFYKKNYIIHYRISNVGAGNAINIKFMIDGKLIIPPFTLIANSNRAFIINLKSQLLNKGNRFIRFTFEYDDVASIGKYEQCECIEFYLDEENSLNTRQAVNDTLSMPKDFGE